jgi:predicted nucleic acid-binding protein
LIVAPDSGVAIAAIAPWHEAHHKSRDAIGNADIVSLSVHVAFETTSALSRMPEGHRVAPAVVFEALERSFPRPWLALEAAQAHAALAQAIAADVRGGALYDALIAATANANGAVILSSDRRATPTYKAMEAAVMFVG